jgi:WD40 repeat protein
MTLKCARRLVLALATLCPALGVLGYAQPSAPRQQQQFAVYGNGPVALAMRSESEAVVLQLRGRVSAFDVRRWMPGQTLYSVPGDFDATDMSAASWGSRQVMCLVLDSHGSTSEKNFILQLVNGREVWSWLNVKGVYTAVGIDGAEGFVYTSNSTTNGLFRLRIGEEKQTAALVATFYGASRIGAIAVDPPGQRVFVADYDGGRIFVWEMKSRRTRTISTPELSEIRALAWDGRRGRLYIADSGSEGIWSVPEDGGKPQLLLRDRRFRQPSGLAMAGADALIVADESSGSVFSVGAADGVVRQVAALSQGARGR